jgi:competence protein ComEA
MKISKAERAALGAAALLLAFGAGWFVRDCSQQRPMQVAVSTQTHTPAVSSGTPSPADTGAEEKPTPSASQALPTPAAVEEEPPAPAASGAVTPAPDASAQAGDRVNINTADLDELMTLPGIGEVRGRNILADRQANGPYTAPEDLLRVDGIGEGILAGLRDYITTGEEGP